MANAELFINLYDEKGLPLRLNEHPWKLDLGGDQADSTSFFASSAMAIDLATSESYKLMVAGEFTKNLINQIRLTVYDTGKASSSRSTAQKYMNAGYGTSLDHQQAWPEQPNNIAVNGGENNSAHMSVHGTFEPPEKMNFFFPMTITTPAGLEMKLLLGRISEKPGWLRAFKMVNQAAKALTKACLAADEDDESDAWEQTKSFGKDVIELAKSFTYRWYVTVVGTPQTNSMTIPEKFTDYKHRYPRLLCIGEGSGHGKHQAACFYYDPNPKQANASPNEDNAFSLRVYDSISYPIP